MRAVVLLVILIAVACATFSPNNALDSIQQMVNEKGATCTTWSVANGKWSTARHCVQMGGPDWHIAGVAASVFAVSPDADMALLAGPVAPALRISDTKPPIGATVLTYGYAFGQPDLLFFSALVVSNHSESFTDPDQNLGPQMLISGTNGMSGMSGGPVFWQGRVVSQHTGGGDARSPAHLLGSGVTWEDLYQFMRQHIKKF